MEAQIVIYAVLYFEFFKIGLFAIGGGLAAIPFLYEAASRYSWISAEKIPEMLAVAQIFPGAIGVNLCSYAASYAAPLGVIMAPLGLISPQIAVIALISKALDKYQKTNLLQAVFTAVKPAAAGLLAAAAFFLCRGALLNPARYGAALSEIFKIKECIVFLVILFLIFTLKKHPALYIALGAACGIALKL
ncbi:MAG: chromate transporter [Spirochaetaceae bacterium]|nr:chromate transporter [Spirochaetaceae bacterium]